MIVPKKCSLCNSKQHSDVDFTSQYECGMPLPTPTYPFPKTWRTDKCRLTQLEAACKLAVKAIERLRTGVDSNYEKPLSKIKAAISDLRYKKEDKS